MSWKTRVNPDYIETELWGRIETDMLSPLDKLKDSIDDFIEEFQDTMYKAEEEIIAEFVRDYLSKAEVCDHGDFIDIRCTETDHSIMILDKEGDNG